MGNDVLTVYSEELSHAREALTRTVGTIYALYGVVMPLAIGGFAFFGDKKIDDNNEHILGFIVLFIISTATSYANALWMEAHQYLRYMYLELMPRMYSTASIEGKPNFFEYLANIREKYMWRPMVLFQLIVGVGVAVLSFPALWQHAFGYEEYGGAMNILLFLIAIGILCAATYTSVLMMRSAVSLEASLKSN